MRYLSFEIRGEQFGIQLEKVKEVIAFPSITPAPGMPTHCLGLMRLREQVLPVIDLRIRLKLTPTLTHDTAVVVCELGKTTVGLVVDFINTVVSPDAGDIMPPPMGADGHALGFVSSIVRRESGLTLILDVGQLISASDEELIQTQAAFQQIRAAA